MQPHRQAHAIDLAISDFDVAMRCVQQCWHLVTPRVLQRYADQALRTFEEAISRVNHRTM